VGLLRAVLSSDARGHSRVIDLFRKFDRDGDGHVSFDEFERAMHLAMPQTQQPSAKADIQSLFAEFDRDGSGIVQYEEMDRALRLAGHARDYTASEMEAWLAPYEKPPPVEPDVTKIAPHSPVPYPMMRSSSWVMTKPANTYATSNRYPLAAKLLRRREELAGEPLWD